MEWTAQSNPDFDKTKNFHGERDKLVAAIISNCQDNSARLDYISELSKYIPIDIYGSCGRPCPKQFSNGTAGQCRDIIASEYKFFLAFENSFCKHYITEKFFTILPYDTIPVVLGGGDYEHYVSGFFGKKKHRKSLILSYLMTSFIQGTKVRVYKCVGLRFAQKSG